MLQWTVCGACKSCFIMYCHKRHTAECAFMRRVWDTLAIDIKNKEAVTILMRYRMFFHFITLNFSSIGHRKRLYGRALIPSLWFSWDYRQALWSISGCILKAEARDSSKTELFYNICHLMIQNRGLSLHLPFMKNIHVSRVLSKNLRVRKVGSML